MSLLHLLLAQGCEPPSRPPGAARTYLRAVEGELPLDEALAACATQPTPAARGDCAVGAVLAHGPDGGACPRVEDPTWRGECWFLAAEALRDAQRPAEAARACLRAGPFVNDCIQHLWQEDPRLGRDGPPRPFEALLPGARAVHDAWAPYFEGFPRFDDVFWSVFYRDGFRRRPDPMDLAACDPLPPPDRRTCRREAAHLLRNRIVQAAAADPSLRAALCADPRPGALPEGAPRAVDDPLVRQTFREAARTACRDGDRPARPGPRPPPPEADRPAPRDPDPGGAEPPPRGRGGRY